MGLKRESAAVCCWCKSRLVELDSEPGLWWCPSPKCAQKQLKWGVSTDRVVPLENSRKTKRVRERVFIPTPRQVDYLENPAKYRLFGGAAGPGKSHAARWGLYRRALTIPKFEALILRETFPELERTHLRRMAYEADLMGAKYTDSKHQMRFENGSIIEGGHLEDDAAVRKYLSSEYDHIIADEGSSFDPKALLEVSTRARTSKPAVMNNGGSRFDVVSNPGGRAAGMLEDMFINHDPDLDTFPMLANDYRPEEWAFIPALLDDNPYLDPGYERQLALLPKWRYEQLRHGDWTARAGLFFSRWSSRRHVREICVVEPQTATWVRSLDHGYHDPTSIGWWVILPDSHVHRVAELKLKERLISEVVQEVKAMDRSLGLPTPISATRTYADPSVRQRNGQTGESTQETYGKHGMPLIPAVNERENGWMRMHALMGDAPDGTPWMTVDPSCRYFIKSVSSAVSDEKNPDDIDYPDDHALDDGRYFAMSRPMPQYAREHERPKPGTAGHLLNEILSGQTSRPVLGSSAVMHG